MNRALRESPGAECLRLQEEASSARKRFQLYRARTYGRATVNLKLLFRLERAFLIAEDRLRGANRAAHLNGVRPSIGRT